MTCGLHASFHFTRSYRQFLQIANLTRGLVVAQDEVSTANRDALKELNRKKMACQIRIGELGLPSIADCAACIGGCCGEPATYYFTPIDHWLALHGSPRTYPYQQMPQEPFHDVMKKRVIELSQRFIVAPERSAATTTLQREKCHYLGVNGCVLPHEERPIKCHLFVCSRLKTRMDDATQSACIRLTGELCGIARDTFAVLKEAAHASPGYGVVTLALTF